MLGFHFSDIIVLSNPFSFLSFLPTRQYATISKELIDK